MSTTLEHEFLSWIVRNWNSGAVFTVGELLELHDQWTSERS